MTKQNPDNGPNKWFAENAKHRHLVSALKKGPFAHTLRDPNIVGLAYGRREAHGERTDTPAMIVYVTKKVSRSFLPPSRLIPRRWTVGGDCVEIDVMETGPLYPLAFTARERPARFGISVGNANEASAGTFGCLVLDNTDDALCILSNNHVLARENAAALGETIVQPGVFDGGSSPADDIATLKRFVTINATGNVIDCAIAGVTNREDVTEHVENDLITPANSDHPAVGLLFAGGCNRTILNPIGNVLSGLNVRFPDTKAGSSQPIVAAEVDMALEKVGRTTEYTTSSVTEIDLSVTINYEFGPASYDSQIATAWMSDAGDSGSVVYRGGDGGNVDKCGSCGAESASSTKLNRSVKTEGRLAREIRDKYLRHTKIGRWAVDLYYLNEAKLLSRFNLAKIDLEDIEFARKLYDQHLEEGRVVAAAPAQSERTVTATDLREAKQAIRRAKKYLTKREGEVADKLHEMASERLLGKNAKDALALLQDEKLLAELQGLAESVPTLTTKDCDCGL